MEGEGRFGVEMVSAALGRLCPWQGKDYMTSLKMRGVTESTHQMGVALGGRWFVGGHRGGAENKERKLKGWKAKGEGAMREEGDFLRWADVRRGHRL